MAVTAFWFGAALTGQFSATAARRVDWATDTVKVALTTSTYTPNQDTHDFFNDVTNEVSASGYTAGGASLANKTSTYTAGTNVLKLDADDVTWTTVVTARYAVIYKDTGVTSTSPLLGYVDFGANVTSVTTFTIVWDATDGILKITAS